MTSVGDRSAVGAELLTPSEVAAAFRVDPKTVTRWAVTGRLSCVRTLGGHRRFPAAEVEALLRGGPSGPAEDTSWELYPRVRLTVEGMAVPGRHDGTQAYIPATADSAHVWLSEPTVRDLEVVPAEGAVR